MPRLPPCHVALLAPWRFKNFGLGLVPREHFQCKPSRKYGTGTATGNTSVPSQWFASQIRASVGAPRARTRGSAGFGTPRLYETRIPQQVPAHGATRPSWGGGAGARPSPGTQSKMGWRRVPWLRGVATGALDLLHKLRGRDTRPMQAELTSLETPSAGINHRFGG